MMALREQSGARQGRCSEFRSRSTGIRDVAKRAKTPVSGRAGVTSTIHAPGQFTCKRQANMVVIKDIVSLSPVQPRRLYRAFFEPPSIPVEDSSPPNT